MSEAPLAQQDRSPRRRRRWWVNVAVVVAAFFVVQLFVTRDVVRGQLPLLEGALADGTAISAAQWRAAQGDDAFLLYVWASWCAICKVIETAVDSVARDAPVLTIATQSGGGGEVSRFLDARGLHWPTVVDQDGQLSRQLGVHGLPALIFVGRDGQVRAVTQGYTTELGIRLRLWWARRTG